MLTWLRQKQMSTPIKVTDELIEKAKVLRAKGHTQEEIALELGITQGTVSRMLRSSGLGGPLIRTRKSGHHRRSR